ncbi:MAG: hypothetical protein REI12_07290 [Pedobacter sp.]|nr:hypothetical protein [Pedobacter sp.]
MPASLMTRRFAVGMAGLMAVLGGLLLLKHQFLPAANPPTAYTQCPVAEARYQHSADPHFSAQFIRPPHAASAASPWLLLIKSPDQEYWFRFASSNGYGGIFLVPVHKPRPQTEEDGPEDIHPDTGAENALTPYLEQLRFYPLDEQLRILDDPPQDGPGHEMAPKLLLMPELGNLLWYEPGLLDGDTASPRQTLARGFFRLRTCARQTP